MAEMADEMKPAVRPAPVLPSEEWGAFSQGDLGLRAAYWQDQDGGELVFRPIVGWVTWNATNTLIPTDPIQHGLAAVVMNDRYWPVPANFTPRYAGVFPKDMSADDARGKIAEWGGPQDTPVNTPFTGQA
jgi:hypothetical protein